ncbi:MAG: hypothetical protein B7Z80_04590 [Rhodospirillales bacterium 20-64-7]|nr:MAG: hypothetical protein B7Z80_04590 [Rhodospirillales bacterium 20-64-7]
MDVSSHTVLLPAGADVPEWVHLLPAGTFKGVDGRGPYKLTDPARVIEASMAAANGKLPLDENHSTQLAATIGAASPARGWIVALQMRDDGIWGKVDWNAAGHALMTDKSYKGISPVFTHTKDGVVVLIKSAALTNNPNLADLQTMHAANPEEHMDKLAICTALGLAGTVDDAAVLTALQTAVAENTRLTNEVTSLKATMVPAEQVIALQTRLNTLEGDNRREKAVAFVDGAIKAGKPITAVRDQMIAMHVADQAGAEALINGLVSINAAGGGRTRTAAHDAADGDGDEMMTADDMAVCAKMGLDHKAFIANRKKMAKTSEGSAA